MLAIAVCDDEVIECCNMARKIKDILEEMKISCFIQQFRSGTELLQAVESFDMIFLDIMMQNLDGIKTAQIFRKKAFDKILIFISCKQMVFCSVHFSGNSGATVVYGTGVTAVQGKAGEKNYGGVDTDDSHDIGINSFYIFFLMSCIIFPTYSENGLAAIFKCLGNRSDWWCQLLFGSICRILDAGAFGAVFFREAGKVVCYIGTSPNPDDCSV